MGKRLGQHFLKNKEKIRWIIEALELKGEDTVIEIGPGHGELTGELGIKKKELRIIGIEKDPKLVSELKNKFQIPNTKFQIIEGDVLRVLPLIIRNSGYKIVGNIPYYVTGKLLRIIGDLEHKPEIAVFTVQKEVAERICAKPPKTNLLAASVQFWAEPEIVDWVSRRDFRPVPRVDSAIMRLRTRNQELGIRNNYFKLIKILFKQPRKTTPNNLLAGLGGQKEKLIKTLQNAGINPSDRPQDLSIETIKKLAQIL